MNDFPWNSYREFISKKRNKECAFHIIPKELESPFTEEELKEKLKGCINIEPDGSFFEKDLEIPHSLFYYLTKVSREFYVSLYPIVIHSTGRLSHIQASYDKILDDIREGDYYILPDSHYADEDDDLLVVKKVIKDGKVYDDEGKIEVNILHECMLKIGDDGCAFNHHMCLLKGPNFGTVWRYMDDCKWLFIAKNLEDYLYGEREYNKFKVTT